MVKTLVIYSSKYGSTKKYAEWIAEELDGELSDLNKINQNDLNNYSTIILGISLYPGRVKNLSLLEKSYEILKDKNLIIYTCGIADVNDIKNVNNIKKRIKKIIPENIFEKIKIFYLRGSLDYKKMGFKHRIMMWVRKNEVIRKGLDKKDNDAKLLVETYGKAMDFINKESINGIIEYCK